MSFARRCVLIAFALALSGCGRGAEDGAQNGTFAGSSDGSAGDVAEARAYADKFITENPDRCFADVGLDRPTLEARISEGLGPRVLPTRVVVAVDGSGSMAGRIGGQTKLDLARDAAVRFLDGLPASVQASLIVFGEQGDNGEAGKARSCKSVDLLAPMSNDRSRLSAVVSRIRAVGWTPLAAALDKAEALFAQSSTAGDQVIYVVSDGRETCGGDPVSSARRINGGATRAIVNIIGFGLPSSEAAALKAVSAAGGGNFVNVNSRSDYDDIFERVRESNRQASNAVRRSNAIASNAVQTSNALASAAVCVSNIVSSENVALSNDLAARAVRGEAVPFGRAAQALLKQRHAAMKARLKGYGDRLRNDEAQARGTIDAAATAVR